MSSGPLFKIYVRFTTVPCTQLCLRIIMKQFLFVYLKTDNFELDLQNKSDLQIYSVETKNNNIVAQINRIVVNKAGRV